MKMIKGFSLIELIIFIVVVTIISVSLMKAAQTIVSGSISVNKETQADEAANSCIAWFVGQRYMHGYDSITSPSTATPSFCTVPSGLTISVNVATTTLYSETNAFKTVTVTITGAGKATMSLLLSDY